MFDEVIEVIESFHGNVHEKKQMSQTLIVLKSNLSGNVPYPDSDQFDNFKRFFLLDMFEMFMPMSFMGRWQAVFYIVCCGPVQRFLELPPRTPDRPYLCSLGGCWAPCFMVTFGRWTTTHLLTIPKGTLFVNVCDTFQYMS